MRKLRNVLCLVCLALLAPALVLARRALPQDSRALVAKKYAGWSGVLRLWIFEGWQPGDGTALWLNRCIAGYERRHPGVYVQPQYVDAGAIASFRDSGILPPDLLLFPPGLLDGAEGLLPLAPAAARPELAQTCQWDGALYAVPVAMGGYMWAWNAALIDGLPDSWQDAGATLAVPPDDGWRAWSAALLALCSGGRSGGAVGTGTGTAGVDLGLAGAATPAPTAAPAEAGGNGRPLPEDFAFDGDAWRRFINGEAAATPVTQREIRRLEALAGQGRGPDWRLEAGGAAFTDQLLLLAVVDKPDGQAALCRAFAEHLLSDACQGELHRAGAFSVTGADSGYAAGDPLARMEAALGSASLAAPGAFDRAWRADAAALVRQCAGGDGDAARWWRVLAERLRGGPGAP